MKKPVWVIFAVAVATVYLLGTPACTKEEDETSGYDKFYATVLGKWNVVYQGQFNSTDSTRDTLAGTPIDFMEFRNTDTVYSHTLLPIQETAPFTVLNVSRFLIGTDTIFNRSLTEGMLRFYYREPLTDTSYTERWVDLKKAE